MASAGVVLAVESPDAGAGKAAGAPGASFLGGFPRQAHSATTTLSPASRKLREATLSNERSTFIPKVMSPGPAAFNISTTQTLPAAPQVVFGTGNRDHAAKQYISKLHSAGQPQQDTPGPGTYRVTRDQDHPHSPKRSYSPHWKFGTAAQRPDEAEHTAPRSPGPVYAVPAPADSPAYTFAPMGSKDLGMQRSRTDGLTVFISAAHSAADRTTSPDIKLPVGPGHYAAGNVQALSHHKRPAVAVFGSATRDARDSYSPLQMASEPLATTAADTPFGVYDVPSPVATSPSFKFSSGKRMFSPEKGPSMAGPYLSRLHESVQCGTEAPGPGAYLPVAVTPQSKAVAGWLGDAPTYSFGGRGCTEHASTGPGPGAYQAQQVVLSRSYTAPSFTMGPALRNLALSADQGIPGPGTYDLRTVNARPSSQTSPRRVVPGYTMAGTGASGRNSFVASTTGPGPAAYVQPGVSDAVARKGFSFGVRERTVANSTVGIRYHGPLAAREALGTQSPGPQYDVRDIAGRLSPTRRVPDIKFGMASRSSTQRVFISRLHAEAEGVGCDSPGPGAYDNADKEISKVTSRYRKAPCAAFPGAHRFDNKSRTF